MKSRFGRVPGRQANDEELQLPASAGRGDVQREPPVPAAVRGGGRGLHPPRGDLLQALV